jgi:NitT/TauT family transport system substrate-binding protein
MKIRITLLRLISLALLALAACKPEASPPLRIGMNVWPGYEPLFLARRDGGLPERDFRLVEFSDASEVSRAFRNGSIEAACLTLDEVLYTVQDGMDPVILLVMDDSRGADVVLAHPEIKSLAELRGKRVAVEVSAVGAYMLTRSLQQAGLTTKDVKPIYLPIEEHLSAYKEGVADAVVTFEPVRTRVLALGAIDLFNSSKIPGEVVDVLVVRRDYLERLPERGAALRRAWFAALQEIRRAPRECAQFMAVREQTTAAEFESSLHGLHFPDEPEDYVLLGCPSPKLVESAEKLKTVMHESGLLARDVPLGALFTWPEAMKTSR